MGSSLKFDGQYFTALLSKETYSNSIERSKPSIYTNSKKETSSNFMTGFALTNWPHLRGPFFPRLYIKPHIFLFFDWFQNQSFARFYCTADWLSRLTLLHRNEISNSFANCQLDRTCFTLPSKTWTRALSIDFPIIY